MKKKLVQQVGKWGCSELCKSNICVGIEGSRWLRLIALGLKCHILVVLKELHIVVGVNALI